MDAFSTHYLSAKSAGVPEFQVLIHGGLMITIIIFKIRLRPRIVRDGRIVGWRPRRQSGNWKWEDLKFLLEFWMEVELQDKKLGIFGFLLNLNLMSGGEGYESESD